jgi:hypothetical protein
MVTLLTPRFPGCFEEVDGALHVHSLIKCGLFQARPDSGARGEVNHLVEPDAGEQFIERGAIGQIAKDERKGSALACRSPRLACLIRGS